MYIGPQWIGSQSSKLESQWLSWNQSSLSSLTDWIFPDRNIVQHIFEKVSANQRSMFSQEIIFRFSLLDKSSSKSSIACVLCLIKRRHFSIYASVKFWKIKVDNGMSTLLHLVLSSSCALKPV